MGRAWAFGSMGFASLYPSYELLRRGVSGAAVTGAFMRSDNVRRSAYRLLFQGCP